PLGDKMAVSIDLRVGITPFEFWHEFGEDQINVINSKVFVESKKLVLSCDAKPVDSNQRSDAKLIFRNPHLLTQIVVTDERVFERFTRYVKNHRGEFDSFEFAITFENQKYQYPVKVSKREIGGMVLQVQA
ncbi:hypothetical protein ACVYF0_15355, partial [Vibrio cholerae]